MTGQATLHKPPHTFHFRWDSGGEPEILDVLVAMVNDPALPFDWFDAAVVSHQIGVGIAKELQAMLPKVKK